MRSFALGLIILSEILILLSRNMEINTASLSFMTTLIVVVIVAFSISAILQTIKTIALSKNYLISGITGVVAGALYYTWVKDHLNDMILWLQNYGLYILLLLILVSALILYFSHKKVEKVIEVPIEKSSEGTPPEEGNV